MIKLATHVHSSSANYEHIMTEDVEIGTPQLVWSVSLMYIGSTMLLTRLIRTVLNRSSNKTLHLVADDMLSTFQAIACALENSATKRTYGSRAFTFQLFLLSTWHGLTMSGCGNPCGNLFNMIRGKQSIKITSTKIVLQLLGGMIAWCYAKGVWSLRLSLPHADRYSIVNCDTDLNTRVWLGCVLECSAALLLVTLARFQSVPLLVKSIVDAFVTVSGIHLTGMYYNPANATIQNLGCQGATYIHFFLVYWIAPLVGCYLATVVDGYRRNMNRKKYSKVKLKHS